MPVPVLPGAYPAWPESAPGPPTSEAEAAQERGNSATLPKSSDYQRFQEASTGARGLFDVSPVL